MSITPSATALFRLHSFLLAILVLSGCSLTQVVVRSSQGLMENSIQAMNRETDLQLAKAAIPANLKMLEGMIESDPGNVRLKLFAAEGYYGYTFAFVEQQEPNRASQLYTRCYDYAADALHLDGLKLDPKQAVLTDLTQAVQGMGKTAVPALFWSASCLAKWVDLNRDDPRSIAQLGRAAALMQRVLDLEPGFYHAGPQLFFGVYYGSRSPMLGGNLKLAGQYFDRASELTHGELLMVNVLRAEYLSRQQLDRADFHRRLQAVVDTPADRYPDLAFANQVARQRAAWLLSKEADWF